MSDNTPNLDSLFLAAAEIKSAAERAAFLADACGDDDALRQQIEQLLQSDRQAGSFMDKSAPGIEETIVPDALGKYLAASLDAGLAAAFSEDAAVVIGDANHSVLRSLSNKLNEVPHVSLRESAAEGEDPIARPSSPEIPKTDSDSRYRLDGEIARGGMGAILKGRDTDLGRDLAIKVLLDSHKDKPEVIQRFVEEAQIGGQLQHPGIAPIYELGQFADKRPFFAMKLVKGQTLSKLLADRQDAADERVKFIGIFEQVCQTMAYAHSRGVIHRDLKSANIMVGAFGEVQVMDWGLAKVFSMGGVADEKKAQDKHRNVSVIQTRRSTGSDVPGSVGSIGSQTQMGSVMGTPAYMPPEQALGEIDHVDQRSDVFGLGAILCEILTGKPPYMADDGAAALRLASRGKLDDAFSRLDACGADAELRALARECLAVEPGDRPRDAGVLAARVAGYLESVETKLRQTELQWASEAARVKEQKKRLRVTLALAATVLLVLASGIVGTAWQARQATLARDAEAERAEELQQQEEHARKTLAQSLFNEANVLRLARLPSYRDQAVDLIRRARLASSDQITVQQAKDAVVACMGDFAALAPKITELPANWKLLAFHPESRRIAAADAEGRLVLRDADGTSTIVADDPDWPFIAVRFSRSGNDLAILNAREALLIFRQSDSWRPSVFGHPPSTILLDMAFEPGDDHVYLCGLNEQRLLVIKCSEGMPSEIISEVELVDEPTGEMSKRKTIRARFTAATDRLAIRDLNGMTKVLEIESGNWIGHTEGATESRRCMMSVDERASLVAYSHHHGLELVDRDRSSFYPAQAGRGVAVSANGEWVAYLDSLQRLVLWSGSQRRKLLVMSVPSLPADASLSTVEPTTASTNRTALSWQGRSPDVGISFDANNRSVFLYDSRMVCEWILAAPERRILLGHRSGIPRVDFDASGNLLASACGDGVVRIWDVGKGTLSRELTGYAYPESVAFGPADELLIGDQNGRVEVRNIATDEQIVVRREVGRTVSGLRDAIYSAVMSTDGNTIAAATLRGEVFLHQRAREVNKFPETNRFKGAAFVRISPDNRFLLWLHVGQEGYADLGGYDLVNHVPWKLVPKSRVNTFLKSYVLNSRGEVVYVSSEGELEVWGVSSGKLISSQPVQDLARPQWRTSALSSQAIDRHYIASTVDGDWLATTNGDVHVIVWKRNTESYQRLFSLPPEAEVIWSMAWSRDGKKLAVGTSGGSLSEVDPVSRTTRGDSLGGSRGHLGRLVWTSHGVR